MTYTKNDNVINDIKSYDDEFFNIIFADPPYILCSKIAIDKETNKLILLNAQDFMGKWKFDHIEWEIFFNNAYRTLKSGGYCILYGIDRQLPLIQYYGIQAGFEVCQNLYWYFTSSFPKAFNVGKAIDKKEGCEREVVKEIYKGMSGKSGGMMGKTVERTDKITIPSHPLAKKYEGYKYSIAPLKQTCETIMVYRKPMKYKSILENVYAYENGENIHLSIQDIDGNRVTTKDKLNGGAYSESTGNANVWSGYNRKGKALGMFDHNNKVEKDFIQPEGRYPSQLFIDQGSAEVLDEQSGVVKSGSLKKGDQYGFGASKLFKGPKDTRKKEYQSNEGGCSRINNIIKLTPEELYLFSNYDKHEFDVLNYNTKVNGFERNAGCDSIKPSSQTNNGSRTYNDRCGNCGKKFIGPKDKICNCDNPITDKDVFKQKNPHPTVKSLSLNYKIMKLFVTPDIEKQNWYIPFSGVSSEVISAEALNIGNIYACEGEEHFVKIGKARSKFWRDNKWFFTLDKEKYTKKKNEVIKDNKKLKKENGLYFLRRKND